MPFANLKVPAGTLDAQQKKHAVDTVTDLYVEFYGEQARQNVMVLTSTPKPQPLGGWPMRDTQRRVDCLPT